MRALAVLLVVSCGCRGLVELVERDPTTDADAGGGADAAPAPDCGAWAIVPADVDPCDAPAPSGALVITAGTWVYDTNSGALTDPDQNATFPASALVTAPDGTELRALSVEALRVDAGSVLVVRGARPLLALAWSNAQLAGTIDATSRAAATGAGADPAACDATRAGAGTEDVEGAGGGGGGGLGRPGAPGGAGNDALAGGGTAGGATAPPIGLRGGCAGARGGNVLGGDGGAGGGAIAVAARDELELSGSITAGGAGGGAAQGGRGGGGGGGSGGVVMLAAPALRLTSSAVIAANGGGGGGGSDNSPASRGQDGAAGADAAPGGPGQGMGGSGGAGGAATVEAVAGTSPRRGGGGGGGGAGAVVLDGDALVIDAGAVVSPMP